MKRIDYDGKGNANYSTVGKGLVRQRGTSFCLVEGGHETEEEIVVFKEWVPIKSRRLFLIPA